MSFSVIMNYNCAKQQKFFNFAQSKSMVMLRLSKLRQIYLTLFLLPVITHAQQTDEYFKPGFKLIFYDDFNERQIDKTKWMTRFTWGQCLPGSLSYFTPEGNFSISDGVLYLIAKKEMINVPCGFADSNGVKKPVFQQYNYTSAVLTSYQTFKYGYYECRFKVPRGMGFNAAFWLYGAQNSEIDVFEIVGSKPDEVQTTLHWQGKDPKNGSTQWFERTKVQPSFDSTFHTMAVLWTPDQLTWYLDGKAMKNRKQSQRIWQRHIPVTGLNIILDMGVGIIDPAPDATTPFPASFMVDYIKAYSFEPSDTLQIISMDSIKIKQNDSSQINFKNLVVVNQSKLYPHGYKLCVLPGSYYHVRNDYIIPFKGFRGKLTVPVMIDNGTSKSNIYVLEVLVDDFTNREKLKGPAIELVYPPGNMEVIVENNSDPSGRIFFNRMEFMDDNEKVIYKLDPLEPGCIRITRNGLPAGMYYLKFIRGTDIYFEKVIFK